MRLLLYLLLGQLFQSSPGISYQVYDVECTPSGTYICGSFRVLEPSQEPAWSDAFVLKIDGRGQLLWEKHLKTAGGDYISQIASDGQGGVYLAGSLSGHFDDCWNGRPSLDWNCPTFLAHLNAQDQLVAHQEILCKGISNVSEPWLKTYDLQVHQGQLALAGSFEGQLGPLVSPQAQSFVAKWATFPGQPAWTALQYLGDGSDYRLHWGPPFQLKVPQLPDIEGVRQQLHWRGSNWAIASIRGGLDSRGGEDAQLWREDGQSWVPQLRWGTSGADRYEFLRNLDQDLLIVGTSQGALPGQAPNLRREDRLVWARLDQAPGPAAAVLLGEYSHSQRLRELAAQFQQVQVREVEFEHLVGWTELGPILTTPGSGFDSWLQLDFAGQQLSRWDPAPTQSAPLLPNVEPYLAGSLLLAHYPPGQLVAFAGGRLHKIVYANSLHLLSVAESNTHECWWTGWERDRNNGRYRVVLGKLDAQGRSQWIRPVGDWELEESPLSLGWSPTGVGLLGRHQLTCLDLAGKVLRRQKLKPAEAVGIVWQQGWSYVRQSPQGFLWESSGIALDKRLARVDQIAIQEGKLYLVGQSKAGRGCLLTLSPGQPPFWMELSLEESLIHALKFDPKGLWLGGEWELDGICRSFWGLLPRGLIVR